MGRLNLIELLGMVAGALTTGAYFPQLVSVWRARSGRGLTYSMLAIFNTGVVLWILYGVFRHSLPLVLANSVTLLFSGTILALKIAFDIRERQVPGARSAVATGNQA